jgi:hypothetical protein
VAGSVIAGAGEACQLFAPDLSRVIALEIVVDSTVDLGDTLRARAILHTAGGDSTPGDSGGTVVYWASFDPNTLAVVDSARGVFLGRAVGPTSLQAWSGNLRSAPIAVDVRTPADSLFATNAAAVDTIAVGAGDSLSDSLTVEVADAVTAPPSAPTPSGLAFRPVSFALTPASAAALLVTSDTTRTGAMSETLLTSPGGVAAVKVRYFGGATLPDSFVVTASAQRGDGTPVPGSPITFVVYVTP